MSAVEEWACLDDERPSYPLMAALSDWVAQVVEACSGAWDGICKAYDNHSRRDEYRQMQADNDIAASVADLRGVKALVHSRLIELRAESDTHASKVLAYAQARNQPDARVHFRLKMLYDAQYKHTQSTMSAIEAHIVALEATAVNRRVVRALRRGSAACDEDDEQTAEDAIDDLAEQQSTTTRIIELLSAAPNLAVDDGEVDEELSQWLQQSKLDEQQEEQQRRCPTPTHHSRSQPDDDDLPSVPTHHVGTRASPSFAAALLVPAE